MESNVPEIAPESTPETVPAPPISGEDAALPTETVPELTPEESGQTSGQELLELVEAPARPLMTTPLNDYTVTEGLLLLIFVLLLVRTLVGLVKEVL